MFNGPKTEKGNCKIKKRENKMNSDKTECSNKELKCVCTILCRSSKSGNEDHWRGEGEKAQTLKVGIQNASW